MNGSRAANAALLAALRGRRAGRGAEVVGLRAGAVPRAGRGAACRAAPIAWGAQDCSSHDVGRLHRRGLGGDAGRVRLPLRHRRPLRATRAARRERRSSSPRRRGRRCAHGLTPIVCVGETLAEREAGATEAVVARQLAAVIDAARRTRSTRDRASPTSRSGRSAPAAPPRPSRPRRSTRFLRARLPRRRAGRGAVRILYGGSVKADNAA